MSLRRIALLLVVSVACLTVRAEDKEALPATEQGLLQYAQQHSSRHNWRKGEQAYKLVLERFPKTVHREDIYFRVARLHISRSRHYSEAARWLDRMQKEFPQGRMIWQARYQRAEVHRHMHELDKAVALMRDIALHAPDPGIRQSASRARALDPEQVLRHERASVVHAGRDAVRADPGAQHRCGQHQDVSAWRTPTSSSSSSRTNRT